MTFLLQPVAVVYATGNGRWSIARGTVPLALFGPARFLVVMGRLAAPNLIVQSAAPFAAGLALIVLELRIVLVALAVAAAGNALLALTLMFRTGQSRGSQGRATWATQRERSSAPGKVSRMPENYFRPRRSTDQSRRAGDLFSKNAVFDDTRILLDLYSAPTKMVVGKIQG